ncbi:hypothetical protein ATERTT37_006520 [Aspergillus terreus]
MEHVGDQSQLQSEARREFEKEILLGDSPSGTSNRLGTKTRVLRASDVLLSLAGRPTPGTLSRITYHVYAVRSGE